MKPFISSCTIVLRHCANGMVVDFIFYRGTIVLDQYINMISFTPAGIGD